MSLKYKQIFLRCFCFFKQCFGVRFLGFIFIYLLIFGGVFLDLNTVLAEDGYLAQKDSQNVKTIIIEPGKGITVEVKFKNTGTKLWRRNGNHFLELVTSDPVKRKSLFEHKFWEKVFLVTRLKENIVHPGQIGTFRFALLAPDKIGHYNEKFRGVAKRMAWVDGLDIDLSIFVMKHKNTKVVLSGKLNQELENKTVKDIGKMTNKDYSAFLLIKSKDVYNLKPGEIRDISLGFKNTGRKTWYKDNRNFISFYTIEPKYHKSFFYDKSSWMSPKQIKMSSDMVKPGQVGYFNFKLQAPDKIGLYRDSFQLAAEDKAWVEGGKFVINLNIIAPANIILTSKKARESVAKRINPLRIKEPVLRVGLFHTFEKVEVSGNTNYKIIDGKKSILVDIKQGERVFVRYDKKNIRYEVNKGGNISYSKEYLRLSPNSKAGVITIISKEDRPRWNKKINYNQYKGILEFRYNSYKKRMWVINEVGMEEYLKGLVETSNSSPMEYLKTMSIAGRTYALSHFLKSHKHYKEFFHVDATYDQVYKGYTVGLYMPNLVIAVDQTRGMVVTYNNEVAVTPYFTQSNGRTRSWKSVWGSDDYAWCQSVPDPYNQGRPLLGHGVGLSARGALLMALKSGSDYSEILHHYYTGIEIEKYY